MEMGIKENEVLKQLEHKRRSIGDLSQIIGNMCDDTPNYTLFLGAGCSVTSGINSGQYLIDMWKREIYESEHEKNEDESDFWKRQYSWFDERNPYSSLFEKRFDLPRQRRIFVEKQIDGKTPSMGYAYLVKLIENKYVNTIFTTNFDDLLNEAFYRYSKIRPIVCAHDSSISSITITSKRPKIIKLHGDYLFDDIKSTLRETESLNDNMKDKFIEFSKDHGLVVIGYAGNDRSIMDILNMLLQKEDYLKYGIYWCIRKGDSISEELRKLLWKDRVYFVEIKGFDELMAFLNKKLNKGMLPIDDELLSSKRQKKLIQDMINGEYFDKDTKDDEIISHDIKELNKIVNRHIVDDVVDFLSKNGQKNQGEPRKKIVGPQMNDKEKDIISQIQKFISFDDIKSAEQLIKDNDVDLSNCSLYNYNLIKAKIDLEESRTDGLDINKIGKLYNILIENWPDVQSSYMEAFFSIEKRTGIEYLNQAIARFPMDYNLYNVKSKELLRLMAKESIIEDEKDLKDLDFCINESLKLNDSYSNAAWYYKCKYYEINYKNRTDVRDQKIKEVFEKLGNYKFTSIVKILVSFYKNLNLKEDDCIARLNEILEYSKSSDNWELRERTVLALVDLYQIKKEDAMIRKIMSEYEDKFKPSDEYIYKKVDVLIYFKEYGNARSLIVNNINNSSKWKDRLFSFYCNLRQKEKAEGVLNKYFHGDFFRKMLYHSFFGESAQFLSMLQKYEEETPLNLFLFSAKCCSLIKEGKSEEAFNLCKPYIENNTSQDGTTLINYFLSGKLSGKLNKIEQKVREKILSHINFYDKDVLSAAYALVGDKTNMYKTLLEVIKDDELMKFSMKEWPVFEDYKNEVKFIKQMDTSNIKI